MDENTKKYKEFSNMCEIPIGRWNNGCICIDDKEGGEFPDIISVER